MARRPKIPKSVETSILLQSGRRCCLCFGLQNDSSVKEGQIAHIDQDNKNNSPENLVFLCLEHHNLYDSQPSQSKGLTSAEVKDYRESLYRKYEQGLVPNSDEPAPRIIKFSHFNTSASENSTVLNAAGNVNYTIRGGRRPPAIAAPLDSIGANIEMRSYIEYLLKRYIEWRNEGIAQGIDSRKFFPGVLNDLIKKNFGARANLVPQSRFAELVDFIQSAIDRTVWGRNNRYRNYHSFDEHHKRVRGD